MKNTKLKKIIFACAASLCIAAALLVTGCNDPVKELKKQLQLFSVKVTKPENGKITVFKNSEVLKQQELNAIAHNTELTFELSADENFEPVSLTIDEKKYTNIVDGKITQKVKITKNTTVTGEIKQKEPPAPKTFAVTVTPPKNGKITVFKNSAELTPQELNAVEENTDLTFELSADENFEPVSLTIDGTKYTNIANGKITQKVKITKNTMVTGSVIQIITVTVKSGSGNKITVNEPSKIKIKSGSKWSEVKSQINVVYTSGWDEKEWRTDNSESGGILTDEYIFTEDKTVFALAKKILLKFKVDVTKPENGKITIMANKKELTGEALNEILENTVLTITVSANPGYCVQNLKINTVNHTAPAGSPSTSLSQTITITENLTVSCELKKLLTITVQKPENGTISVLKNEVFIYEPDFSKIIEGTVLRFKLSANTGFKVKSLTITPENESPETVLPTPEGVLIKDVEVIKNLTVKGEIIKEEAPAPATSSEDITIDDVKFTMIDIKEVQNKKIVGNTGVDLSAYQIAETETTQKLYNKITGKNPSANTNGINGGDIQELRPVETVSWFEAVAFCNMLTEKVDGNKNNCVYYSDEQKTIPYTAENATEDMKAAAGKARQIYADWTKKGFRLPTEAEWEWAARGGTEHAFSGSDDFSAVGWGGSQTMWTFKTHEVKKKAKNGYGLYDMSGNVCEWVWNVYIASSAVSGNGGKDPKGPISGKTDDYRVARGGSGFFSTYTTEEYKCTNHTETGLDPKKGSDTCGFRIARKK